MNNVDEYILNQEPEIAEIVALLREIIMSFSPFITEKIAYKIPFYYGFKRICYINVRGDKVDLGICRGSELSNTFGILESKNRKIIKTMTIKSVMDVDEKLISEIIGEAIVLDELKHK